MTANKSIDGLSTRANKKRSQISHAPKKITPSASEEFISEPETNIWDAIKLDEETPEVTPVPKKVTKKPKKVINPKPQSKPQPKLQPKPAENTDFLKPIQAFDFDEETGLKESTDTVDDLMNFKDEDPDLEDPNSEDTNNNIDSPKPKKSKKEKVKKLKKKPSKKRKVISIVTLVIVLLLIAGVLWAVFWGNDIIAKLTGGRGNLLDLLSFTSETYEPLKTDANGRTNILAFGTGGYDMEGEEGGGVHDGAQLTDSIMLISFDQKTGDTVMISLPRDLKGPATCTSTGKINEVYWCNGGGGDISTAEEEAAATALMDAVGTVLGVDIQYYAHLNWGSLASIVDILGGITITLDEDINDYLYTEAVYEAGVPYEINGAEAVGLARARHGTSGGDFSRGASQQKIIIGIKNKLFEKHLSITDILGLVSTLGDNLRTNFSVQELKTLAHSTEILNFDVMRQISLYPDYMTTGTINNISYVLPKGGAGNYTAIQNYLEKQLSSDPRDYEEPTIAIYNATDTAGLAAQEKTKLESAGFTVTKIDNAPAGEYPTGTTIYAISNEKPGTKNLLEEHYGLNSAAADTLPATIAPNYDFIIILNNSQN